MAAAKRTPTFLDPDELDLLPRVVWVPLQLPQFGDSLPKLLPREMTNGYLTLPVYSSLETLRNRHGESGHAIKVHSSELERLRRFVGFATVALDLYIPPELRVPDWEDEDADWPEAQPPDPEVVWVPCRPVHEDDTVVHVELHPDETGELVLAVYTSHEELFAACGPYQPAAAFRVDDLAEIAANVGAESIIYNPTLDPSARHCGPGR